MDWDKLKIFHAVAEAGSFTSATVILNLSQSAISRQIQSLEEDLKVKLWGVDSVNISKKRKEFVWGEFPALLDFDILEKSVNTIGLDELLNIYPDILKGNLKHKIVVDVNK